MSEANQERLTDGSPGQEDLVESHMAFVGRMAREFMHLGIPIEDIRAEGYIGLIEAATRFDATRGVKFATYARWWVRKRIFDLVAQHFSLVRLPKVRLDQFRLVCAAQRELRASLFRTPTSEEIARRLGMTASDVDFLLGQAHRHVSLHDAVHERTGLRLEEVLPDAKTPRPDTELLQSSRREQMGELVQRLPERQREILSMHYGLEGRRARPLAEIGRRIGLSRERVRQLELRALRALREQMQPDPDSPAPAA